MVRRGATCSLKATAAAAGLPHKRPAAALSPQALGALEAHGSSDRGKGKARTSGSDERQGNSKGKDQGSDKNDCLDAETAQAEAGFAQNTLVTEAPHRSSLQKLPTEVSYRSSVQKLPTEGPNRTSLQNFFAEARNELL